MDRILRKRTHTVAFEYISGGAYAIADLKADISRCVLADDDILTQFMEPAEILEQLEAASTFGDFLALLARMNGEEFEEEADEPSRL